MPKINSRGIDDCIMDLDDVAQSRLDALELGEFETRVKVEREIFRQESCLRDYRRDFIHQRRVLTRSHLIQAIKEVEQVLLDLATTRGEQESNAKADPTSWQVLRADINATLYGEHEPIPVDVEDLSNLTQQHVSGRVATRLKWEVLQDEGFERLIYSLIASTKGYEHTDWLMKTRAPDGGRDVSTWRITEDPLRGRSRIRVIVQCKHWQSKSIALDEIAKLKEQMRLWEPPLIDELIIATSGRFVQDAVKWIESNNER